MRRVFVVMNNYSLYKIFLDGSEAERYAAIMCDSENDPNAYHVEEWEVE